MFCREMRETDISSFPELVEELGFKVSRDEIRNIYHKLVNDDSNALYVVEAIDQKVVGWVHVAIYTTLTVDKMAIVLDILVSHAYRGVGLGKLLMEKAELWAINKGCLGIRLYSNVNRPEAHKFYNSLGYEMKANSLLFVKHFNTDHYVP